jgi:hypothetical protein
MPDRPPIPPNPCFDGDPLDGYTEIDLPSDRYLRAFFDVDLLDTNGRELDHLIDADESFKVRFRVVLYGELWYCICGDWCFNVGFTAIGEGQDFNLSTKLGREFWVKDWKGCDTRCITLEIDVPANTIPQDYCGTLYECGGWGQLHCCNRGPVVVAAAEALEERFFFK